MVKNRPHWKRPRITTEELLDLFANGTYRADLDEGIVYKGGGKPLAVSIAGKEPDKKPRLYVRLYRKQRIRWIQVAHVIWIVGAERGIPEGFEIHHKDLDPTHNWWDNLFCLCQPDHRKLHRVGSLIDEEEETPF